MVLLVPGPLVAGVGVGVEDARGRGAAVAENPLERGHLLGLAAVVKRDGADDGPVPNDLPQGPVQASRRVAPHFASPLVVADAFEKREQGGEVARATDKGVALAVSHNLEPIHFRRSVAKGVAPLGGDVVRRRLFALGGRPHLAAGKFPADAGGMLAERLGPRPGGQAPGDERSMPPPVVVDERFQLDPFVAGEALPRGPGGRSMGKFHGVCPFCGGSFGREPILPDGRTSWNIVRVPQCLFRYSVQRTSQIAQYFLRSSAIQSSRACSALPFSREPLMCYSPAIEKPTKETSSNLRLP